MPRIQDELLDCVIYLYPDASAADEGKRVGGSGFLVGVHSESLPKKFHIYAVTNKHVACTGGCSVIRLNTKDGDKGIVELEPHDWEPNPADDIAVVRIAPDTGVYRFRRVPEDIFITAQVIDDHNIGPGDDCFMVGRFINHEGRQRNLPSVRFGNIGMMPLEPIEREDGFPQESFAVEMRSIGGYSGSPVFVHILPGTPRYDPRPTDKLRSMTRVEGPWLLGVDWGHIASKEPVLNKQTREPVPSGDYVVSNSGMVGVVPAWKLHEFLHSPKMKEQRMREDEEEAKSGGAVFDSVGKAPPTKDENPQHKEDFNSLLDAAVKGPQSADQT